MKKIINFKPNFYIIPVKILNLINKQLKQHPYLNQMKDTRIIITLLIFSLMILAKGYHSINECFSS